MPRVPTLTGPSVQLRPLNVPETQAAAEGMGPAIALGVAAEALGGVAEIVSRADRAVVENAEVGFAREVDQLFTNEAQTGFLQQRGVNARDAYQKLGEQFDAAEQKAMEQLNGRQRAIFRETASKSRVIAMRRADDYLNRELEALEDANSRALTATTLSRITLDAANPASVDGYMTELRERAMRDATRAGLDTTARDALVAEAVSTGRFTHIRALANNDRIDEAAAMFERYKGEITDPQQREQAQNLIEQETLRVRAQREADNIIATAGPDRRKALTAARDLTGTLRDNVEQRVEAYYRQQDQLRKEEQEASVNAVSAQLEQTGSLNFLRGEQLQAMRQIPGAMQALQARERQLQGGGEAETNWDVYAELMALSPEQLRNPQFHPSIVRSALGDTEFKQYVSIWSKAKNGDNDGARFANQTITSVDNLILQEGANMRLFGPKALRGRVDQLERDDRVLFGTIKIDVARAIEERESELRRPLSASERRTVVFNELAQRKLAETEPPVPMTTIQARGTAVGWATYIQQLGGEVTDDKILALMNADRLYVGDEKRRQLERIARGR